MTLSPDFDLGPDRNLDTGIDPDRDLLIERVIRAPKEAIWSAWTEPAQLVQWWIPTPLVLRVDALDLRPGGAFVTRMSEDGQTFTPHVDAVFLRIEENERLVFTNAVDSSWHPALPAPVAMTTEIILGDGEAGTDYRAVVRHASPEQRAMHEELGFFEGWGTVTEALARLVER
ncbi:SRPBCC domain-containing protein [Brevibacterium casei]